MSRKTDRQRAGRYVVARRAALGLTQDELADRAGVDIKTLGAFERGARWPTTKHRSKIEAALGWAEGDLQWAADGGFPASGPLPGDDPDGLIEAAKSGVPKDEFARRVQAVVADLPPRAQVVMNEMLDTFANVQRENARLQDGLAVLSRRYEGNGPGE